MSEPEGIGYGPTIALGLLVGFVTDKLGYSVLVAIAVFLIIYITITASRAAQVSN